MSTCVLSSKNFSRSNSFRDMFFGAPSRTTGFHIDIKGKSPISDKIVDFSMLNLPNVLSKPLTVSVIYELDYVLLSNDEYNVFGYGETMEDAKDMLEDDLLYLKRDLYDGLINEGNTDSDEIEALKELFGNDA